MPRPPTKRSDPSSQSRFSLLGLLPARHPPLHISHPRQLHPDPIGNLSPPILPAQPHAHLLPPRQYNHSHHVPQITAPASPVLSQAASPLTSYPETPGITFARVSYSRESGERGEAGTSRESGLRGAGRGTAKSPPRRPPPIDLDRVRAAYPSTRAINDVPLTPPIVPALPPARSTSIPKPRPLSPPILATLPDPHLSVKKGRVAKVKVEKDADDPFDIAYVEPGHRYASWRGGKVDIRPGQVIPAGLGLLGPSIGKSGRRGTIRGVSPGGTGEDEEEGAEQYDSVLHNVLLTPTYLRASPMSSTHSLHPRGTNGKRETLLDKARRASRFIPLPPLPSWSRADPTGTSVQGMKEREMAEMKRFRRMQGLQPLGSRSSVVLSRPDGGPVGLGGEMSGSRSPGYLGQKEERMGNAGMYGKKGYSGGSSERRYEKYEFETRDRRRGCLGKKRSKEELEKMPTWRKLYLKYRILIAILVIVGAAISLAAVLLVRRSGSSSASASTPTVSDGSTPSPPTNSISSSPTLPTGTATASTPAPTSTSRTLQTCLDLYLSPPSSSSAYPCADCTPLLLGTVNDFTTPLVNGNSTGVGGALQMCTLLDLAGAGNRSAFEALGWTSGGSAAAGTGGARGSCGWTGVRCDARGRVTELSLTYPNVPYHIPSSIGQIPTLQVLRIKGNASVPAGPFPSSIISPSINTLDISDTALQGPIASFDFSKAQGLTTVYLANNPILGSGLPDLRSNGKLLTLAMTGQLLSNVTEANLPSSLTYLDLSFNAISGQIPTFSALTGLKTLYLESNQLTSAPSALPAALTDLKLINNPALRGNVSAAVCASAGLASCDLRNTGLGGAISNGTAPTGGRTCGRCQF